MAVNLDEWARANGWLVLAPGEAYEKRIFERGSLFIYAVGTDTWEAVYHSQNEFGDRLRILAKSVSLERARKEAEGFEQWIKNRGRSKRV